MKLYQILSVKEHPELTSGLKPFGVYQDKVEAIQEGRSIANKHKGKVEEVDLGITGNIWWFRDGLIVAKMQIINSIG